MDLIPNPTIISPAESAVIRIGEFAEMLQEEFYEISRKTASATPTETVGLTKTENVE